jgi:hypothetical protein
LDVLNNFGIGIGSGLGDKTRERVDGEIPPPLFLYTAYTAAHAPLQPAPEHAKICDELTLKGSTRFPHLWYFSKNKNKIFFLFFN